MMIIFRPAMDPGSLPLPSRRYAVLSKHRQRGGARDGALISYILHNGLIRSLKVRDLQHAMVCYDPARTGAALTNWKQLSTERAYQLGMGIAYGMTDVGPVRSTNEDNFLIDEELDLVIIGDGMGGHDAGEIASAEAIMAIRDFLRKSLTTSGDDNDDTIPSAGMLHLRPRPTSPDSDATWSDETMPAVITLFDAVEFANDRLFARNNAGESVEGRGMGTTLTGFWKSFDNGPLVVFHVGDSRLYRYRPGDLALLTRDHTLYQQAIESGAIDNLPARNLLLQAVGPYPSVKPDVQSHAVVPGDLLMLCTDGLHGSVPHAEIEDVLAGANPDNLQQSCAQLIALAKEYGGRDNITVVLTKCRA
jgi:serine/threonine protein phosphatase PrpC